MYKIVIISTRAAAHMSMIERPSDTVWHPVSWHALAVVARAERVPSKRVVDPWAVHCIFQARMYFPSLEL